MLTTSGKDQQIYNYGTCHRHCNRSKSDILSMKFDTDYNNNIWVVDETGINDMIKAIANSRIHASEYDPEFINIVQENSLDIEVMKDNLMYYTELWCEHANGILGNVHGGKMNVAKRILKIIKYTYDNVEDKFKGGAPETEGSEVFKLDQLNGFEIDDNLEQRVF
jgi:hypothetical protein